MSSAYTMAVTVIIMRAHRCVALPHVPTRPRHARRVEMIATMMLDSSVK